MLLNPGDVRTDMEVLGLDGRRVGMVGEVWPPIVPNVAFNPMVSDEASVAKVGPPGPEGYEESEGLVVETVKSNGGVVRSPLVTAKESETAAEEPTTPGYFEVRVDAGAGLYIPFSAIQVLFPGENLTVMSTVDECRRLYSRRPDDLDHPGA